MFAFLAVSLNFAFRLCVTAPSDSVDDLHILGLFPMSGNKLPSGQSNLHAAKLAVQHINDRPDILPGYRLVLDVHDSAVSIPVYIIYQY